MTPVMFSLPEINLNLIVMIYKKLAELNDKNMEPGYAAETDM